LSAEILRLVKALRVEVGELRQMLQDPPRSTIDLLEAPPVPLNVSFVTTDPPLRGAICSYIPLRGAICSYMEQLVHEVSPNHLINVQLSLAKMVPSPDSWTVGQVIAMDIEARRDQLLSEGKSVKTANNHVSIFHAFLAWCVKKGYAQRNAAAGLTLRSKSRASRRRKAFTDDEVKWIFEGLGSKLVGAPCVSRYWLPVVMLYTGARPEEIAQLRVCDVQSEGGLGDMSDRWYFDFTGGGANQRIKNDASRRRVPVHPRLIELGFFNLFQYRMKNSENLIFDQLRHGARGRLAEAPSRWFNEVWLRDVKAVVDPKKVLYSLRHSVATKLKHSGVEESMIAEILGHTNNSMSTGRYGKEYPLKAMAEAMHNLDWGV